jgi:3-oxoacyl-[acyl-carrier protein] reductase
MFELKGQSALVTGGSRGIGLAISRALAEAGARVAVLGRNGEAAREAALTLPGEGHLGFACDVADPAGVRDVVSEVEQAFGEIAILVNNAGITRDNLIIRLQDSDWDDVVDTNLKGAFLMTRAVAKGMMKRRDGVIVNISSVVGLMGNPGQTNYAASKSGLFGLTKSVARELASRGVRCNAVAPGFIETDMTDALDEKQAAALRDRIPLGRLGAPEDVAGLVRFLAGPSARYITGQIITVDGGMVM